MDVSGECPSVFAGSLTCNFLPVPANDQRGKSKQSEDSHQSPPRACGSWERRHRHVTPLIVGAIGVLTIHRASVVVLEVVRAGKRTRLVLE